MQVCPHNEYVSVLAMSILLFFFFPISSGSQLRLDQFKFTHRLAELQRQPVFQLREFESVIDTIRDCVAEVGTSQLKSSGVHFLNLC